MKMEKIFFWLQKLSIFPKNSIFSNVFVFDWEMEISPQKDRDKDVNKVDFFSSEYWKILRFIEGQTRNQTIYQKL